LEDCIFIVLVWCRIVITLDDLHNKWYESVDENVTAFVVLTPLFEEVYQFLTQVSFTMFRFEYL